MTYTIRLTDTEITAISRALRYAIDGALFEDQNMHLATKTIAYKFSRLTKTGGSIEEEHQTAMHNT